MTALFDLHLIQPSGPLSAIVQGIWSAATPSTNTQTVDKPLYSDGGSGFLFNLGADIELEGQTFARGSFVLPNQKYASEIFMPPGSNIAGIRFHPGIGYGIWRKQYDKVVEVEPSNIFHEKLINLVETLHLQTGHAKRIESIQCWLEQHMNIDDLLPGSLEIALHDLNRDIKLGELEQNNPLSQRQIERLFKLHLGMTPKHFQRILRIKRTMQFLRENTQSDLADVAHRFGFSDQAHMTREFKAIASITPSQLQG